MKFKIDAKFIEKAIEDRKINYNCEIVDRQIHEVSEKSLNYTVYTWDEKHSSNYQYLVYFTKNGKRISYNMYTSAMERDGRLFALLSEAEDHIKTIKERKQRETKRKEEMINSVKIGDIFVSSWGYDQTNVDAYQVIEKKSKTLVLAEIRLAQVSGTESYMSCRVVPVKDAFIDKNITIKKLISFNGIKISSYNWASKWDGKSSYYNSWYA